MIAAIMETWMATSNSELCTFRTRPDFEMTGRRVNTSGDEFTIADSRYADDTGVAFCSRADEKYANAEERDRARSTWTPFENTRRALAHARPIRQTRQCVSSTQSHVMDADTKMHTYLLPLSLLRVAS